MTAPVHDNTPNLVVLAAGGTGGHVFPAEALAAELSRRGCRLMLVTDRRGGALGGRLGEIETHRIRAGGIAGKSFFAQLGGILELAFGTLQAWSLLARLAPAVVIGFGGYASVPTMFAATRSGRKTAIHEQNAVLGRANRLLARRVQKIATSFARPQGVPPGDEAKLVHTGMPVRPAVIAKREVAYPPLTPGGAVDLLVMGGSQGAHVFSHVVPDAMARLDASLRTRLRITQQCRPEDIAATRERYRALGVEATLAEFFTDVPELLAKAHLVICRSGASTIAETMVIGRPAVMVPYPHAADDHQSFNAHAVAEAGGGWLIPEAYFTAAALAERIASLLAQPETLIMAAAGSRAAGHPDAAGRLADMVLGLLPDHDGAVAEAPA